MLRKKVYTDSVLSKTKSTRHAPPEDLRRHRRYHTGVTGRFIAASTDVTCTIVDISAGGAKLKVDFVAAEGDDIALSIPNIGFMRGSVCRLDGDTVSVSFDISTAKMDNLLDRIAKYFADTSSPETQNNKS